MNPSLAFPPSYLLNLLSCLLTDYLYPCPLVVFQSHFHTLGVVSPPFQTVKKESKEVGE